MATLRLEVVTPDKTVFSSPVEMAICPGIEGEFGVLVNHASLLSALKIGQLKYRVDGKDSSIFISGGFADVNNNVLSILAESAELVEDIDVERAKEAKARAEKRLESNDDKIDRVRAESALKRAIVRISMKS